MNRAFTLIELVVVVGIMMVLYAIISPIVFSARLRGKEAACISNLHQIGLALQSYRQDYDEYPNLRPPDQLQPYIKSDAVFVCPLEYRDLKKMDSGTNHGDILSSYMYPCIPTPDRDATIRIRGDQTPEVICPVHVAISSGRPFCNVLRMNGSVQQAPFAPAQQNGNLWGL